MPERRAQEGSGGLSPMLRSALQGVAIWFTVQWLFKTFLNGNQPSSGQNAAVTSNNDVPTFEARPKGLDKGAEYSMIPANVAPIWAPNSPLDIRLYISPSIVMPVLSSLPAEQLILNEKGFRVGDWKDKREISTSFAVPKDVQNNGTLWAHFYVGRAGSVLDPLNKNYDAARAYHFSRPLNQYLAKKRVKKTKKLLGAGNTTEEVEETPKQTGAIISSFYHPNFTVSVVPDSGVLPYPSQHPAVRQFINLETTGSRDGSGQNTWYYPILFLNTFWQLRDHMTELNSTVKRLPIRIKLDNMNNWKFNIYASIDDNVKTNSKQAAQSGGMSRSGDGSEFEEFKRILVDTNIYLLATTGVATVLHMVFEALAFKSDVSHFRQKKDNVGISVRTILANVVMQSIVMLYLMDNSEGTSWMILFGQGMGIAIEAWKITKTVDVRVRQAPAGSLLPYHVTFEDKHKLTETEKKTKEYDQIAFKYMYIIAVPLLAAYAVYSVIYESHKSWYSFVITTLVGSVYAYGFLLMVPSLYINYRLKSVAHMPRKAMTYKFLNTFIDDLFAFTITMPTLHRLATLRDDVIFFIYLYQAWKYKVDYTRVNEFGQGGGEDEEVKEEDKAAAVVAAKSGNSASATAEEALDVAKSAGASGAEKPTGATKRK